MRECKTCPFASTREAKRRRGPENPVQTMYLEVRTEPK